MSSGPRPGALIFLHGSGDNGEGIASWLSQESGGAFESEMRAAGVKVIYPDAPAVPYSLNGGHLQTVWFDRVGMSYEAPEDAGGMARSVEQVDAIIDGLVAEGIPLDRIGVAGMSMGACLALHVGYGKGRYAGRVGLVGSMSTFLAEGSALDEAAAARFKSPDSPPSPPLFMAHGGSDPMIRLDWARKTHHRLELAGVRVPAEVTVYPGVGHELCPQGVQQFTAFVRSTLGS